MGVPVYLIKSSLSPIGLFHKFERKLLSNGVGQLGFHVALKLW
jgi:hypothetical protein